MAKYYRRRFYRKRKYNIENRVFNEFLGPNYPPENGFYQSAINIVPASTTEGVRKVTRFNITVCGYSNCYWALVYIPEGATTTALFPSGTELFRPSNYVLASGVSDFDAGPIRISSRIQKNLNAGDQIYLLVANTSQPSGNGSYLRGLVRYAIAYN